MQGDGRGIASLDAGNQHMHLALARFLHKLGQKGASDAAAAGIARHIDRKFGGMAEALERAKRAIARIAEYSAVALGNQHRKTIAVAGFQPFAAVFQIDKRFVPDGKRVLDGIIVDGQQGGEVCFRRVADEEVHCGGPCR